MRCSELQFHKVAPIPLTAVTPRVDSHAKYTAGIVPLSHNPDISKATFDDDDDDAASFVSALDMPVPNADLDACCSRTGSTPVHCLRSP